ncbi:MAG: class I SAM-dependent methyltransferase [Dehalococcoidia bacterium]|nr:class I SAM-dependent methyltransferase [Dehalococcoidia bacterium]
MSLEPVFFRPSDRVPPLDDDPDDFMGYEVLVDFLEQRALQQLDGDFIEIGAFMGRGTAKLAALARRYDKMVYVIDPFEPGLDQTLSKSGIKASEVYEAFLRGRSMLETYQESTRGFDNILTIREDSRKVRFGGEQRFCFGFIDGCHDQVHVENDYYVIWPHLVPGGILGLHDYRFDEWPEVTTAVDKIVDRHSDEICEAYEIEAKYSIRSLLLVKK